MGADCEKFFAHVVEAVRPYLNDLLFIGGMANALYRHHELAKTIPWEFLGTKDVDVAAPSPLPPMRRRLLYDLVLEADFEVVLEGTGDKCCEKYVLKGNQFDADLEFLCPLSGARGARGREGGGSLNIQKGLRAQPLQYLEVLFRNPWEMDVGEIDGLSSLKGTTVRVPNPAAYVMQKILIRDQRRKAQSKAKDCFYIYEISAIFRDDLDRIAGEYARLPGIHTKWRDSFEREIPRLFGSVHSEGVRSALRVFEDSGKNVSHNKLNEVIIMRSVGKLIDAFSRTHK